MVALLGGPSRGAGASSQNTLVPYMGVYSVSVNAFGCASAGNCLAIGAYDFGTGVFIVYAVETQGRWGNFSPFPNLNTVSPVAGPVEVVCYRASSCTVLLGWMTPGNTIETFVATESAGRWTPPVRLRAPGEADTLGQALWCSPEGQCAAVATSMNARATFAHLYVSQESAGGWSQPHGILPAVLVNPTAGTVVFSCSQPNHCVLAALALRPLGVIAPSIVALDTGGPWGLARRGGASAKGELAVNSVSCSEGGGCVLGGAIMKGTGCSFSRPCANSAVLLAQSGTSGKLQQIDVARYWRGGSSSPAPSSVSSVACTGHDGCYLLVTSPHAPRVTLVQWAAGGLSPVAFPHGSPFTLACANSASTCAVVTLKARQDWLYSLGSGRWSSVASWVNPRHDPYANLVFSSCSGSQGCALLDAQPGVGNASGPGSYVQYHT